ncbi:MAG: hypothetical protein HC831_23345 [Chloroflexia bacterium]|nr:hypothetical protein [Chloroflexia bacterium]
MQLRSEVNDNWNNHSKNEYSISYPSDWELNETGQMGTKFLIFSDIESENDKFRENINLIIQDLSSYSIDLEQYKNISKEQISSMLINASIYEVSKKNSWGLDYYKLVYSGMQDDLNLKFVQYYWVENKTAYILTFTAEQKTFDKFWPVGEKIMDGLSWILNNYDLFFHKMI